MKRPTCINCGKKLERKIRSRELPCDTVAWFDVLHAQIAADIGGQPRTFEIVDHGSKLHRLQTEAEKQAAEMAQRKVEAAARLKAAAGQNEPMTIVEKWSLDHDRRYVEQDIPVKFKVRYWYVGEFGYDGTGTFHSGECAKAWGTTVAMKLRAEGKL